MVNLNQTSTFKWIQMKANTTYFLNAISFKYSFRIFILTSHFELNKWRDMSIYSRYRNNIIISHH